MSFTGNYRLAPSSLSLLLVLFCAGATLANKKPPVHPVNLNSANAAELQQVPGIGPSTADKILQMRKAYGAFKSVDDLPAIKGIGQKRLDKMRKYLTVGKPPTNRPATPAKAASVPAKASPVKPVPKAQPATVSEDEEP